MSRQAQLSEWTTTVSTNLPQLSKPQATVLALWSFGIAFTRSCGRGTVATWDSAGGGGARRLRPKRATWSAPWWRGGATGTRTPGTS